MNRFFLSVLLLATLTSSISLSQLSIGADKASAKEPSGDKVASAENWMRFRGPNGSGISTQKVPTKWSEKENVKWKLDLPGPGTSSPIIVGDKVFVTSYSGYVKSSDEPKDLMRHLVCIDRKTGKQLWSKETKAVNIEDPAQGFINDHGYASSTPTSDGERVYVFYGKSGAYCFDLEGNEIWHRELGKESSPKLWGSGTSPVLYKDLVIIVAADESLAIYGLDKKTGEEKWKAPADSLEQCFSTPILVEHEGKTSIVVSVPGEVWALNADNGKMMWFTKSNTTNNATPSVVEHDGIVYVTGGRGGGTNAIRVGGKGDVSEKNVLWSSPVGSYVPSPLYHDNKLYWVNEQGIVTCLDAATSKKIYSERLSASNGSSPGFGGGGGRGGFGGGQRPGGQGERGPGDQAKGGENRGPGGPGGGFGGGGGRGGGGGGLGRAFYSSVTLIGDKMYAVSRNSGTFVFDAGDKFKLLETNKLDDSVWNASPAVADGELYLRSNKTIYCISEKTK